MGVDVSVFLFDVPRYERELLPAYRAFTVHSDSARLLSMLKHAVVISGSHSAHSSFCVRPPEVYVEYADILMGKVYYSSRGNSGIGATSQRTSQEDLRFFVERHIAPALLGLFCVPTKPGFVPNQELSKPRLTRHLYAHSRWIEDYLTFAKEPGGKVPEIKLGEWNRLFSKEEMWLFNYELLEIPVPADPIVADEFRNLRSIVHSSAEIEGLGLLLCVL